MKKPLDSLTVYTCLAGENGDSLRWILAGRQILDTRLRFIIFTDQQEPCVIGPWEIRPLVHSESTNRRTARYHKVLSHHVLPDAAASLWFDGSFQFRYCDLWKLATRCLHDCELWTFRHPERDCIYKEHEACVRLRKDDVNVMRDQVRRYHEAGYPKNHGLVATGLVLRSHLPVVSEFNEAWWSEIRNGSCRDQLSFNYVAWSRRQRYCHLDGSPWSSPFVTFRPHAIK